MFMAPPFQNMDDKKIIRKIYKEIRENISFENREKEEARILALLEKHPHFRNAKRLFLYASCGSEFPTEKIAALAEAFGKDLAYPKVEGKEMVFYQDGRLMEGFRGILEPEGGEIVCPKEGDLMLLPGLAFTKEGGRLGYGGGYYDRYLAKCPYRPYLIGLCFSSQMAENLPQEPYDIKVDEVF